MNGTKSSSERNGAGDSAGITLTSTEGDVTVDSATLTTDGAILISAGRDADLSNTTAEGRSLTVTTGGWLDAANLVAKVTDAAEFSAGGAFSDDGAKVSAGTVVLQSQGNLQSRNAAWTATSGDHSITAATGDAVLDGTSWSTTGDFSAEAEGILSMTDGTFDVQNGTFTAMACTGDLSIDRAKALDAIAVRLTAGRNVSAEDAAITVDEHFRVAAGQDVNADGLTVTVGRNANGNRSGPRTSSPAILNSARLPPSLRKASKSTTTRIRRSTPIRADSFFLRPKDSSASHSKTTTGRCPRTARSGCRRGFVTPASSGSRGKPCSSMSAPSISTISRRKSFVSCSIR